MELQDYLRVLRNHWLGVLVITLVCCVAAAGWTATRPKVYAANSSGMVQFNQGNNQGGLANINDQTAVNRATTYVDLATSRAVAQAVIDKMHLNTTPDALVGNIAVTQTTDTPNLKIVARAASPQAAQALADAWVSALAAQVQVIQDASHAPPGAGLAVIKEIDQASLPSSPVSPNPRRNLLLGLLAGLLLGAAYALLRNTLDRRLRDAEDTEQKLGVSVVGAVPGAGVLEHPIGAPAAIAVRAEPGDTLGTAAAEAFRKVRTNLMYMNVDNPPRTLVITSPRPGDGKSTVAANVAAAIEQSGQVVILVDADLRRPTVASGFSVDDAVGVTNVLSGQVTLEAALQKPAGFDKLLVLAAGSPAPNPSELLGSKAMRTLIDNLAQHAIVVLDAPPLLPVTDAALLSTAADGVLLVVSSGRTTDTDAASCIASLEAVNGKVLGVILNRVKVRRSGSGYYGTYSTYAADAPSGARALRRHSRPKARV